MLQITFENLQFSLIFRAFFQSLGGGMILENFRFPLIFGHLSDSRQIPPSAKILEFEGGGYLEK